MSLKAAPLRFTTVALSVLAVLCGLAFTSSSTAQQQKEPTAEQIVEGTILVAGSGAGRALLTQIRKNGLERGRETRTASDGRAEEIRSQQQPNSYPNNPAMPP